MPRLYYGTSKHQKGLYESNGDDHDLQECKEHPEETLDKVAEEYWDYGTPEDFPIDLFIYSDKAGKKLICEGVVDVEYSPSFIVTVGET